MSREKQKKNANIFNLDRELNSALPIVFTIFVTHRQLDYFHGYKMSIYTFLCTIGNNNCTIVLI